MKKNLLTLLLFLPLALFISCSDDDDNGNPGGNTAGIVNEVLTQFEKDYPNAIDVKWTKTSDDFAVAQFNLGTGTKATQVVYEHKAWYKNHKDYAHIKYMGEKDIDYKDLPSEVKKAFEASQYADWEIDDVEEIVRYQLETIYSIEVEGKDANGKEVEVDLYYDASGILIKEEVDLDDDFDKHHGMIVDQELPEIIKSHLDKNHAGYKLADVEIEDDELDEIEDSKKIKHWEIDIIETVNNVKVKKELIFSFDPTAWLYTKWEVESKLPTNLLDSIAKNYSDYILDDYNEYDMIDHNKEGLLYKVELEYEGNKNLEDLYIYFNENGDEVKKVIED